MNCYVAERRQNRSQLQLSTAHAIHVISPSTLLYQNRLVLCSWIFINIFILDISTAIYTYSCGSTIETAAFGIITLYSKFWLMA